MSRVVSKHLPYLTSQGVHFIANRSLADRSLDDFSATAAVSLLVSDLGDAFC